MRYLLVLGFACDVYRREPRARIFVGDKLIDEFLIQHHSDTLNTIQRNLTRDIRILQPKLQYGKMDFLTKNLPPLRFYSIEIDTTVDRTELRIEIENIDNNNNNGFMTKSTLIQLQACCFFPLHQKLLLRLDKIKHKNRPTQNYAWYWVTENFIFNLTRNGLCWKGKNGQILDSKKYHLDVNQIGGDGVFTCELEKKYQILINKIRKPYRHNFDYNLVNYLLNKYIEYANQRDSN